MLNLGEWVSEESKSTRSLGFGFSLSRLHPIEDQDSAAQDGLFDKRKNALKRFRLPNVSHRALC